MDQPLYSPTKTKFVAYGYLVLLLLLFVATYITSAPASVSSTIIAVGKGLGIVGMTMLVGQMILSSRLKMLEKGIGLDRLMLWHRRNAKSALIIILLHPFLAYYQPLMALGLSFQQSMGGLQPGHYVGYAALVLLLVTIVLSITSERLKIPYHWWRMLHFFAYGIIGLGLLHALFVSTAIRSRTWVFWWLVVLLCVTCLLFIYRFVFRPRLGYKEFRVARVVEETRDVRSVYLFPVSTSISYAPGQFAFVRFYSEGLSTEEHHFTLSSSPMDDQLCFTIKELGDYTSQLDVVKSGDKAEIDGPYGVFSNQGLEGPFVFVAGGVGITPIMSMIRTMVHDRFTQKVTLFYGNRTETDVVFKHELEEYAEEFDNFTLIHVYSAEEVEGVAYGIVNKELIEKYVQEIDSNEWYVCGPKPMLKGVVSALRELGVTNKKIHTEIFSLK